MYKDKISGVYKIVNTVTGEFYIGSSVNVKKRWAEHKRSSMWKRHPNSLLYKAMQEYGVDKFRFQILAPVMEEYLKQVEQEFIELLKPKYNSLNAKGRDAERRKASRMKYNQSDKCKAYKKEYSKKYNHHLCEYNGVTLTLNALRCRFRKAGIPHSTLEAKKYLTNNK